MTVIKRNQIIVLALAITIVAVGYLNYTYKESNMFSQEVTGSMGDNLGEATFVENDQSNIRIGYAEPVSNILTEKLPDNLLTEEKSTLNTAQTTSGEQYFVETRIEREQTRDQEVSLHERVIGNTNASEKVKEKAQAELSGISERWEKEMITERLIKAKGFKDVVVFINEENVNVVVLNDGKLTTAQVSQIQDIVTREVKVSVENIKIVVK